jgi:hypothetical protein
VSDARLKRLAASISIFQPVTAEELTQRDELMTLARALNVSADDVLAGWQRSTLSWHEFYQAVLATGKL